MASGREVALRPQISKRLASAESACLEIGNAFRQGKHPERRAIKERASTYRGDIRSEMHLLQFAARRKRAIFDSRDGIGNRHFGQRPAVCERPRAYRSHGASSQARRNRQSASNRLVYGSSFDYVAARNRIFPVAYYLGVQNRLLFRPAIQYLIPDNAVCIGKRIQLPKADPAGVVGHIARHNRIGRNGLAAFFRRVPTEENAPVKRDHRQFAELLSVLANTHGRIARAAASLEIDGKAGRTGGLRECYVREDEPIVRRWTYGDCRSAHFVRHVWRSREDDVVHRVLVSRLAIFVRAGNRKPLGIG